METLVMEGEEVKEEEDTGGNPDYDGDEEIFEKKVMTPEAVVKKLLPKLTDTFFEILSEAPF